MGKKAESSQITFKPLISVLYVSDRNITELRPEDVIVDLVGEKAFGLACLPQQWTLPFVVVSDSLLFQYNDCSEEDRGQLFLKWTELITKAAITVGILEGDHIIVRSSACAEGLHERGQYDSFDGCLDNIPQLLAKCCAKLAINEELMKHRIPLVVQKYVVPVSQKGHLSNERRFYEETRDWLGEIEIYKTIQDQYFQVNLREWRRKVPVEHFKDKTLECNLSTKIPEVLSIPATWVYKKKLRIHFEWVWNGNTVYIVQADREYQYMGIDPTRVYRKNTVLPLSGFVPKCLKEIEKEHADRYYKIRNVFTYKELGLPIAKLYVLDDQNVIANLASGKVLPELENDIRELVKGTLIIRIDIDTDDLQMRQLLPRTQESELTKAIKWLKEKSAEIRNRGVTNDFVFIFHNFIPAISSAFAYAAPNERKVQIEALWGLPEGLYYNAHDKYIVDTLKPRVEGLDINRFEIFSRRNHKHFIVVPDEGDNWKSQIVKPPYDWRGSIQNEEWIKEIAFQSRRIAEAEGMPLSIMWFVEVPTEICSKKVFPWYHEYHEQSVISRAKSNRTKTPFDKTFVVRTKEDLEKLHREAQNPQSRIRRIKIEPCDPILIRNKDTLKEIGELTKKLDAVILLSGGVLSHAYYQLMKTNAIVEVLLPFDDSEGKREFNKLVRDKVSSNIEQGGELVNKTHLSGEFLLRALREKLVEEAFEVLDAFEQESIVNELADVSEVIQGILNHIGVGKEELEKIQNKKRLKAGGFNDGTVLLETRNPLPFKKTQKSTTLFDHVIEKGRTESPFDESTIIDLSRKIVDWTDKREHPSATERILNLVIPMVRDNWTAKTHETIDDSDSAYTIQIQLTGTRLGSKFQIGLSVFNPHKYHKQLTIFDIKDSKDK